MARLIFEDVTLNREHSLFIAQVRFKGGPPNLKNSAAGQSMATAQDQTEIVAEVDRLLEQL
jgi:hypothetical protein